MAEQEDRDLILEWVIRICVTGLWWLGVQTFFYIVGIQFTWVMTLLVAMFIVGTTRFAVRRLR